MTPRKTNKRRKTYGGGFLDFITGKKSDTKTVENNTKINLGIDPTKVPNDTTKVPNDTTKVPTDPIKVPNNLVYNGRRDSVYDENALGGKPLRKYGGLFGGKKRTMRRKRRGGKNTGCSL